MNAPGLKTIHVVGMALIEKGRCFVARRAPGGAFGGYWEFPGGKIEHGETPKAALVREIQEELGVRITVGAHAGRGEVAMSGRRIVLDVYFASRISGNLVAREHTATCWCSAAELNDVEWAPADIPALPSVMDKLLEFDVSETSV